jgi:serine protease AprX
VTTTVRQTDGGIAFDSCAAVACPVCRTPTTREELGEAGWVAAETATRIAERRLGWQRSDGACAACVQDALLSLLREKGERVLGRVIQDVWPLDAEAAFGALPTPLRMRADPRFTGRGVTIAMVDAGFYPHPDLVRPTNRIRAIVGERESASSRHRRAGSNGLALVERFGPNEVPAWPGWDADDGSLWHGLMTSAAAGGNGFASRGLYRGLAPDADLVLVRARDSAGRITSDSIGRALAWVFDNRDTFDIRVASVSLGGDPTTMLESSEVDEAVARLVDAGVVVVVAAGNDGQRNIVPPATAPAAVTVGGLDDRNVFDGSTRELWHSSYGVTWMGNEKPELVAPSIWVAAPVLPNTDVAREAAALFSRRARGDASCEPRIAELKLITPHYQHVEGTSFAAPIVSGIVACMLEANGSLTPHRVRELLTLACRRVHGAPVERQGAGAIDAGSAVALAIADDNDVAYPAISTPSSGMRLRFVLHETDARVVHLVGSWDGWSSPGVPAARIAPSLWQATLPALSSGKYAYKLVADGSRWIDDPVNRSRASDGFGGTNSAFEVRSR